MAPYFGATFTFDGAAISSPAAGVNIMVRQAAHNRTRAKERFGVREGYFVATNTRVYVARSK